MLYRNSTGFPCGVCSYASTQAAFFAASRSALAIFFVLHQMLERRQDVVIVGRAVVGIAGGLRALDGGAEGVGPFDGGEAAGLLQRDASASACASHGSANKGSPSARRIGCSAASAQAFASGWLKIALPQIEMDAVARVARASPHSSRAVKRTA